MAPPTPLIAALLRQEKGANQEGALTASAKQGRVIYEALCTTCHSPDGKGVNAGDKFLAPAFTQSEWFRKNGNVDILVRIVMKGQTGPIKGVNYGEGFMLPLEAVYDDTQIPNVLNYIGERWHKWTKPAQPADIGRVREEIAGRQGRRRATCRHMAHGLGAYQRLQPAFCRRRRKEPRPR